MTPEQRAEYERLKAMRPRGQGMSASDRADLERLRNMRPAAPEAGLAGSVPFRAGPIDVDIPVPSFIEAPLIGLGKWADTKAQGLEEAYKWLRRDREGVEDVQSRVRESAERYAPLKEQYPVGTFAGELAGEVATGAGPVQAAASAALNPGSGLDRLVQGALAFGGWKVGQKIPQWVSRLVANFRPTRGATALAREMGESLTPGQISQNPSLQHFEGQLLKLPGSSATMGAKFTAQRSALNKAIMESGGAAAGPTGRVNAEMVKDALEGAGGRISSFARRLPELRLDDDFVRALADVSDEYNQVLTSQQRPIVRAYISDIFDKYARGELTGAAYQKIRSRLGRTLSTTKEADMVQALRGIRNALDDAAMRTAYGTGDDAFISGLQTARQQYRNLKSVQDLVTPAGDFSPARLGNLATKQGKLTPEMSRLAEYANAIRSSAPDSGTAINTFWENLLTSPVSETAMKPAWWTNVLGLPYMTAKTVTSGVPSAVVGGAGTPLANTAADRAIGAMGGMMGPPFLRYMIEEERKRKKEDR